GARSAARSFLIIDRFVEVGGGEWRLVEDNEDTSTNLHHLPPPSIILPFVLKYAAMPDESPVLAPSRLVRWLAIAVVIVFTVALYFRDGRRVPPLTGTPAAAGQPAN